MEIREHIEDHISPHFNATEDLFLLQALGQYKAKIYP
jgi:hypothetical protein